MDIAGATIDQLIARASAAAGRIANQHADYEARGEYAARVERETEAQLDHALRCQTQYDAEMQL